MSTNIYAMMTYGLHLEREVLISSAERLSGEENLSLSDAVEILYERGLVDYDGSFTGEAMMLRLDGSLDYGYPLEVYYDEPIAYITLPNQPSLLKGAYRSFDAAVEAVKKIGQQFLPSDYDYTGHLCAFIGTTFG